MSNVNNVSYREMSDFYGCPSAHVYDKTLLKWIEPWADTFKEHCATFKERTNDLMVREHILRYISIQNNHLSDESFLRLLRSYSFKVTDENMVLNVYKYQRGYPFHEPIKGNVIRYRKPLGA